MTRQSFERNERGGILLLAAFALVALLMVGGLATDAATLYHGRQALQKAADAGALAAVGYTMTRGWTRTNQDAAAASQTLKQFLEQKAREATIANLTVNGFPHVPVKNPITVAPLYDPNPPLVNGERQELFTVEVTVDRPMNFVLIHLAPQFFGMGSSGTQRTLAARAKSRRAIAHVSLIFDLSQSMACPATGPCTCLTPARTGPCPSSGRKLDALTASLRQFIKFFDYNNDVISVVPFTISGLKEFGDTRIQAYTMTDAVALYNALSGDTAVPPPSMADIDVDKVINQFAQTRSGTNICDGLMRSYHAMSTYLAPGKKTSYVLFSDGAPTGARVLFANPKNGLRPWNPYGLGSHDYTFFDIDWREGATQGIGPSPLYQTNYLKLDYNVSSPPASNGTPGHGGCGQSSFSPVDAQNGQGAIANQVFSPCLHNLGFHVPGGAVAFASEKAFQDWWQLNYDCAVQFTDFLREDGRGVVHVVGLGDPDPNTTTTAYQTWGNPHLRKDIFNARLANDYLAAVMNSPRENGGVPWPEFGYSGYTSYADLSNNLGPGARGDYLRTANASELEKLFSQVAKKIALGLSE